MKVLKLCSGQFRSVQSFPSSSSALHVVGDVDGVELVGEEAVAQVHALLLAARVDRHDARVDDHHDADDQVMLLEHGVRDERNQVQSLVLVAVQLDDNDQEVRPGEHRAAGEEQSAASEAAETEGAVFCFVLL